MPENHSDWQSGNPAVAACACPEKYDDHLGDITSVPALS